MDSERAREILACYRPGHDDPTDPEFAEALAHARRDPRLGRWLEQQLALDATMCAQLREVPVPPDLRRNILARYPTAPVVAPPRRRPGWRALAAPVAVAAAIAGLWITTRRPTFEAYRQHVAGLVMRDYEMSIKSKDLDEIRSYLAAQGSPSDYTLTPAMQRLDAEGGSAIGWRGRKVSLICLEGPSDRDLFLFVVARSAFPDAPTAATPQFARVGDMTTATWSVDDELYLLAGRGDAEFLRRFF